MKNSIYGARAKYTLTTIINGKKYYAKSGKYTELTPIKEDACISTKSFFEWAIKKDGYKMPAKNIEKV